ncbi:MAG TPA: hypothetical protein VMS43_11595 [Allosphingosinicella sp.]|nr:hypothetical protein [Allosphingosinicella sp.]
MTSRREPFHLLIAAAVAGLAGAAGAQTRTRRSTPQRRRPEGAKGGRLGKAAN